MLNEIPGDTPRPEWQPSISYRPKAEPAQLVDEKIGADEIVAPVIEESGDAEVILVAATMIQRPRRLDQKPPTRLEYLPAPRQPRVQVLGIAYRLEGIDGVEMLVRKIEAVE